MKSSIEQGSIWKRVCKAGKTKKLYKAHWCSFPLGKSSCQQAVSMETANKPARASASYERIAGCAAVNLWLSLNTLSRTWPTYSKTEPEPSLYAVRQLPQRFVLSCLAALENSVRSWAQGTAAQRRVSTGARTTLPSSSSPWSHFTPQLWRKAITPSLQIFRWWRVKI